ncbi:MAG: ferredoxin [Burkholderiales bacterium 35-55-47]|uniref:electron transport complex subunit RsxB n=1 Tax=Limnohabitans sp. TaxID=1907725 RepID=UPI000BC7AA54|nr:electron transport complex subunit RsxB [Limnohabitans sp.]OYY19785.1 MAG: ferredoxin [Burkholderiales bacterium 35-55-47]OYZ74605.1 MAG: ferredoxin [Burkholderiales bacterium 24-55-52]OZB01505.1 MAG: ferredoxin [Burkholderiales bacterium 39-55-53]HQR85991.1 electron transport complex subunit RsxB [Limnohabitans sp.]HQS26093.1 electron transport complex subunit RsxB [Limnohabitans sp.]
MSLIEQINNALPQTQCTRCGYPDCQRYAEAIAQGEADINQCPPGGTEGVERLAALTGKPALPLNPENGLEGPRTIAVIDEAWCIGCTLCIAACPTDAIVGANKRMHTVVEPYCTGCELCIPACPVDCISLEPIDINLSGWASWPQEMADLARQRYDARSVRLKREAIEHDARLQAEAIEKLSDLPAHTKGTEHAPEVDRKRAIIEAALAKAKARQATKA